MKFSFGINKSKSKEKQIIRDWGIEDPNGKSIEKVREIRDEIEVRVKDLITKLPNDSDR